MARIYTNKAGNLGTTGILGGIWGQGNRKKVVLDLAERHLRAACPPEVELEITRGHSGEPFLTNPMSPLGLAAQAALERTFGRRPALMREGGSIPILTDFQQLLVPDILLLALAAPDCRAHSPNENFPIENFEAGIRLNRALLEEIAKVPPPGDVPPEMIARNAGTC